MQVISPELIKDKNVLLRYDIDVPIVKNKVMDNFRLEAGLKTLELCLKYARSVILMGHIGRPEGKEVPELSTKPIVAWLEKRYQDVELPEGKFHVMENLRFEKGEDAADLSFAKQLASYGDFFVNEAFASHHEAASTTVLPTLMPHAAGLNFAEEVEEITKAMNNPAKPFIAIIGGIKVEDKLPAVVALAKSADIVLVGGKIATAIKEQELNGQIPMLPSNVYLGGLTSNQEDISPESVEEWKQHIKGAQTILWNGPLGKIEDPRNGNTKLVAEAIINSEAYSIVGGGDTIAFLDKHKLLREFAFASTGGGAMLELIVKGTLPTIKALE